MATATGTSTRAILPGAFRELTSSFHERKLLVWASALAFQLVTAVVPFLLFALGLIGFLDLDSAWADIAKSIKPHVSEAAFKVVNSTADKVLHQKQMFWVTIGLAVALWEVSGGMRTIMGGLSLIYECHDERSWFERMHRSIALAVIVSVLVLAATAVVWTGPLLYGDVGQPMGALFFLLRWAVAAALLGEVPLPRLQDDRPLVFPSRRDLRQEARPSTRVRVHLGATTPSRTVDLVRNDRPDRLSHAAMISGYESSRKIRSSEISWLAAPHRSHCAPKPPSARRSTSATCSRECMMGTHVCLPPDGTPSLE